MICSFVAICPCLLSSRPVCVDRKVCIGYITCVFVCVRAVCVSSLHEWYARVYAFMYVYKDDIRCNRWTSQLHAPLSTVLISSRVDCSRKQSS